MAVKSKGEAFVPLLNARGLDGMTAHWEFAFGPAHRAIFVQGKPIHCNRTYTAADVTIQVIPRGFGRARRDLDLSPVEALERHLRIHGKVAPNLRGTVVAV